MNYFTNEKGGGERHTTRDVGCGMFAVVDTHHNAMLTDAGHLQWVRDQRSRVSLVTSVPEDMPAIVVRTPKFWMD